MNDFDSFFNYAQIEEINGKLTTKTNVMVTVWCPTYNHGRYIEDALEGFVSQNTDFDFQVVIYDDGSTDNSSDIIREYAVKYPNIFHVFLAKRNTYSHPYRKTFTRQLKEKVFLGKYIAICEGDDCWIDSNKLQIQVNYLETHTECSLFMHNAVKIDYSQQMRISSVNAFDCVNDRNISDEEMFMCYKGHPATASMLYRKELYFMPYFFEEAPVSDFASQLNCFINGDVYYSNRIMSIYRWRTEGSYTQQIVKDDYLQYKFNLGLIVFFKELDEYTKMKYHKWIVNKVQLFASGIIDNVDKDFLQYTKECHDLGYVVKGDYEKTVKKLEELALIIKDENYIGDALKTYIESHDEILIMGTGKYSSIISKKLENIQVNIRGYVVSELKEEKIFRNKPVWELKDIKEQDNLLGNYGIIIAINPLRWDTIIENLNEADIKEYYCPFIL